MQEPRSNLRTHIGNVYKITSVPRKRFDYAPHNLALPTKFTDSFFFHTPLEPTPPNREFHPNEQVQETTFYHTHLLKAPIFPGCSPTSTLWTINKGYYTFRTRIICTYRGRVAKEPYNSSTASERYGYYAGNSIVLEDLPRPCKMSHSLIWGFRPRVTRLKPGVVP